MKKTILFVERKPSEAVSIEKVFRQVAKCLSGQQFSSGFQQLSYPNDTIGTVKNLLFFKKRKADIYHITGHIHYIALVLPRNKTVLTIHDAGILRIRKGIRRYILKKLLFDLPIKKLKYVTAVSPATKKELVFHTNCDPDKIRVIENPLQEHFFSEGEKKFDEQNPSILHIGTTANKNLENLIQALQGITCRLIIVGRLSNETERQLKDRNINYENKLNLNDMEIREEYIKADIVSFCSAFEGFGLPIIEAQAMLTPVVTSNISPMKEVAGEGAVLVDPFDYKSIRAGIQRLISEKDYRQTIVRKGIVNVEKYDPEKIARQYAALYQEMLFYVNEDGTNA